MTDTFYVRVVPHFTRQARALHRSHPGFTAIYATALAILRTDPYGVNSPGIRKLTNVRAGEGQYRLRVRRFRFRYDIDGQEVFLYACALRREDTYS